MKIATLARRVAVLLLGHGTVSVTGDYPAISFECRCGGVTEYALEVRSPGAWCEHIHHEFVRTTCPREMRNRRICAERVRQYRGAVALPVARVRQ